MTRDVDRIDVHVDTAPEPGLIRPAIEAAVAGRHTPPGPEATLVGAVAAAVRQHRPAQGGSS